MVQQVDILIILFVIVVIPWDSKSPEFCQQTSTSFLFLEDKAFLFSPSLVITDLPVQLNRDLLDHLYGSFFAVTQDCAWQGIDIGNPSGICFLQYFVDEFFCDLLYNCFHKRPVPFVSFCGENYFIILELSLFSSLSKIPQLFYTINVKFCTFSAATVVLYKYLAK